MLAGVIVSRTVHFAMHRNGLNVMVAGSAGNGRRKQTLLAQDSTRIGALVPKRLANRAVTRNAIKRQIFSVGADFGSLLPTVAHVVRLRAGFDKKLFISASSDRLRSAIHGELKQLFNNAVLPLSSTSPGA